MDYDTTFETRGAAYTYAVETYPHVLDHEFKTAIEMCSLSPHDVLLNIPAACVPLERYIQPDIQYIPLESNQPFAIATQTPYSPLHAINLPNQSVTKIISLASLHHTTDDERKAFYKECIRCLTPSGSLIIGDVAKGSSQDAWLNIFVDQHNASGHTGRFWSDDDCSLLRECGFTVDVVRRSYPWVFPSTTAMIDFCKHLFGLDLASDQTILDGIQTYLGITTHDDGTITFQWELLYLICSNPTTT